MSPHVLPVAMCGGLAVFLLVSGTMRPWRRFAPRVDEYTVASRARLNGRPQVLQVPQALGSGGMVGGVFGPIVAAGVRRLSSVLGQRDEAALSLALEQAGLWGVTPQSYVYQQVVYGVIGLGAGGALGLLSSTRMAIVLAVLGGVLGANRKRSELDRRIKTRRARMQAELVDVCNWLAIHTRVGRNIQSAMALVCAGRGEVVGELSRVLAAIAAGASPEMAFATAAATTPEPAAAGLYRALAAAISSGGNLTDLLLSQAAGLRDSKRDARRASGTRRKVLVTATTTLLMALPVVVVIAAGVPRMIFQAT